VFQKHTPEQVKLLCNSRRRVRRKIDVDYAISRERDGELEPGDWSDRRAVVLPRRSEIWNALKVHANAPLWAVSDDRHPK
jgi:hypothetical protein